MRIEKDCERGESNLDNAACDVAHSIEISCYVVSCVGVAFVHFDVYDWTEIGIECSIICRYSLGMDVRYIFMLHWEATLLLLQDIDAICIFLKSD